MLYNQITRVVEGKVEVVTHYIREHWHEWLWVFVSTGEARPRFYLPVYRTETKFGYVSWILPLAPFVLILVALYNAFFIFWKDCVWAIGQWRMERKNFTTPKSKDK